MATVEHSIFISAPVDVIEDIHLDAWRLPEWFEGCERVEPDDLYPEPGGVINVVYKAAGVAFNIKMTMLELERGLSHVLQMEGMIAGTNHWMYAPDDDGTWLSVIFDYEVPGGGLGKALDWLVVERINTENLEKSLENLRALAEG